MVADSIALVTGPVGMAVAAGVNAVAAIANVAVDYKTFTQQQAAGNVALDPQFQAMVDENKGSGLDGVMFDLVRLGLSILGIKAAISAFKEAVAAARAMTAAEDAQAISDLDKFKKAINGTEPRAGDQGTPDHRGRTAVRGPAEVVAQERRSGAERVGCGGPCGRRRGEGAHRAHHRQVRKQRVHEDLPGNESQRAHSFARRRRPR